MVGPGAHVVVHVPVVQKPHIGAVVPSRSVVVMRWAVNSMAVPGTLTSRWLTFAGAADSRWASFFSHEKLAKSIGAMTGPSQRDVFLAEFGRMDSSPLDEWACDVSISWAQRVSSMNQLGGSMSNIESIPPGKTSLVVISRSLWECHMYA